MAFRLPRKRGSYSGPVSFGQDGWHYPAGREHEPRHRLVWQGVAEHTAADTGGAPFDGGYRYATKDDRPHNSVHELRVVELEGA